MQIQEVKNNTEWEEFAKEYYPTSFLQSWAWGEFAKRQGRDIIRAGLYDNNKLVGGALGVIVFSKRANYLEVHVGPMVDYSTMDLFIQFHNFFIDICKEKKLHFIRVRPPLFHSEEEIERFTKLGYVKAPMYFQAEHTYRVDLDQDIEVLRKNMKKNTRYYVNKAEDNAEIAVTITSFPDVTECFFDLYQKTVERQHFVPYDKKFFEDEYEVFSADDDVEFVLARHKEELVSAAMIVYYADTAYYHHGGSVRREPDSYASYLVQWEAIKRAKQKGMKIYDFFGIAPTDDPDHPRAGLTKFKRGFGGQRVRFLHTLDYPTNPFRYWPMYLYAKLERKRRGL